MEKSNGGERKEPVNCSHCSGLKHPDYPCKRCRDGQVPVGDILNGCFKEIVELKHRIHDWKDERDYWCNKAKALEHEKKKLHARLAKGEGLLNRKGFKRIPMTGERHEQH